jgi:UDP-N-acetylglucosamine 2-epimerase (non-hydrolysing)
MMVVGTRPEAIKMAPVIRELGLSNIFELTLLNTGQHKEMLESAFKIFDLVPDEHLSLMKEGQSLADLTGQALMQLSTVIEKVKPSLVIVHGDTTSAYAASIAAFLAQVPVAHVEAGLRTHNLHAPFPEEFNRQSIARVAALHFAPTLNAAKNLYSEGIEKESVHITGNTVVDAVAWAHENYLGDHAWNNPRAAIIRANIYPYFREKPFALVTLHRRENRGVGFLTVLEEMRRQASANPDFNFVFPVHPNPIIRDIAEDAFQGVANVHLTSPLDYLTFLLLLSECQFTLSDSGGVQEEAATLGKLALVAREATERPEGIETGHLRLVGVNRILIRSSLDELIPKKASSRKAVVNLKNNPYGDGLAARRIVAAISEYLEVGKRMEDFGGS